MRLVGGLGFLFLFKQKTAYEMRISDWSSDVCSSDLAKHKTGFFRRAAIDMGTDAQGTALAESLGYGPLLIGETRVPPTRTIANNPKYVPIPRHAFPADRHSDELCKTVTVRVDFGGRCTHHKNKTQHPQPPLNH